MAGGRFVLSGHGTWGPGDSDSRLLVCRTANEMQATHFAVAKKGQDGDEVARYADHDESDASGYGKVEQLLRILAEQFSWGSSPIRCPIGRLQRRVAPGATAPVGAVFARGPLSRRFIHDIDQTRQISRAIRCGCVLFFVFFGGRRMRSWFLCACSTDDYPVHLSTAVKGKIGQLIDQSGGSITLGRLSIDYAIVLTLIHLLSSPQYRNLAVST